ncbi:NAD-dependent malic enzyme [Candidatus Peregrinibacteria bacterium]|nr:NAD-dependent malic enzyme [Candidatus Peregrinibacteria bacterium]
MADLQNAQNPQTASSADDFFTATLPYHAARPAGKIQITPSKPLNNKRDLSLAYTPGVAAVCKAIAANPPDVWKYTNRGNTVAVISDGTAVLGLGNIGPEAGIPVMEGKAVLFKKFADIDAYPLCLSFKHLTDPRERMEAFITAVRVLEPNLCGINLEDIKAPECFELSARLDEMMDIAVFHDDQYGTAIVMCAGLVGALKVVGKNFADVKIVMNGAGAAGIACAKLLLTFGAKKERIFVCDTKGLIVEGRTDLNEQKKEFAQKFKNLGQIQASQSLTGETNSSKTTSSIPQLTDVIEGADVFIGVSAAGTLKPEMVKKMNKDAIIFAMANPIPEIMPEEAMRAGARIVATGRSDFSNQVNNVLGYPGIFRGVLDTRASTVNLEMKMAAVQAIASLVNEPLSGFVKELMEGAYPEEAAAGLFGEKYGLSEVYVLPKIFDLRVVPRVARRVAEAAMKTGVARVKIDDLDAYEKSVMERVEKGWR